MYDFYEVNSNLPPGCSHGDIDAHFGTDEALTEYLEDDDQRLEDLGAWLLTSDGFDFFTDFQDDVLAPAYGDSKLPESAEELDEPRFKAMQDYLDSQSKWQKKFKEYRIDRFQA